MFPNTYLAYRKEADRPATISTYDDVNRKTSVAYPGHSGAVGDSTYDKVLYAYDAAGKLTQQTDQLGEYVKSNTWG
jgi:hypothetical protein